MGEWYEALDFAKSLNVKRVYSCEFCNPRHADELARAKKKRLRADSTS